MKKLSPGSSQLKYMGRIDFSEPEKPLFIYCGSMVKIKFYGTSLKATIKNLHNWDDQFLGVVIDQRYMNKIYLSKTDAELSYTIVEHLEQQEHEIILYKCRDSVHYFQLIELSIDDHGEFLTSDPFPQRRMEFYGDSITCGEVSEALDYVGSKDPESSHGEFSNCLFAYSFLTAKKLHASIHDIAQGGIALLNDTGYFELATGTRGMIDVYDKLSYAKRFGITNWDFKQYIPHVVVVAIGQNDNYPNEKVEDDLSYLTMWKEQYKCFLCKIRKEYKDALIVCITTTMFHNPIWDIKIQEACNELEDAKIHKFTFQRNQAVTPGHLRIPEAYEMANELSNYIESFGDTIWQELN